MEAGDELITGLGAPDEWPRRASCDDSVLITGEGGPFWP